MSTTSTTLNSTLPKLASNGSNWVIWKMRMQFFLGSKELDEHLEESTPIQPTPEPLDDNANEDARKKFATAYQEFKDWKKADVEVRHYLTSTLPNSLLIKAVKCKTATTLWSTLCSEHETRLKSFKMEMTRHLHTLGARVHLPSRHMVSTF